MSESSISTQIKDQPHPIYLKDYRLPTYFIDNVDLTFDLYQDYALVTSIMHLHHNRLSQDHSRELILNGEELELQSVKLDGQLLESVSPTKDGLILQNVPDHFQLEIITKIFPQKNTALSGLYRSGDTFCTQCEAEGFRRITYYIDRPDVLSKFTTTIIADKSKYPYMLSNGNLIDSADYADGRHMVKWEDPFKKPSYLFALVAGDFDVLNDQFITQSGREITLRIYVEKGYGDEAHHAMHSLKEAMRWDEKAFGREYDLDIYMIVAIGDFNMGAMENKGLNIFNTKYILAKPDTATDDDYINILSVIGHEYFHNWSGNRVTCRDWFQLSLKEGLTIFRDQSFSEDILSHAVMRIRDVNDLRETQFPEDASPLAHPVRPDSYIEINNFYTATVYNKGAEVLRMLQTILGKSLFRKGMDLYFACHDGQAVTIEDFVKTMEDVSGINLEQFRLWYAQAGTPTVNVTANYDASQQTYQLTMQQTCPNTPGQPIKLPFYIPIRMGLLDKAGNAIRLSMKDETEELEKVLCLKESIQTFQFDGIKESPIPSLLRNFSAPIKINYPYSESDLQFLYMHDKDAFNRWEAGQKYALRIILKLIEDYKQGKKLTLPPAFPTMYEHVLTANEKDKFLLAEMLYLPSEKYIGEQMEVVDVDAIHVVREFILNEIAKQSESTWFKTYQTYHDISGSYHFDTEAIGKRQLKNRCLSYLLLLPQHIELGIQQFFTALTKNMTDTQPALAGLANLDSPIRKTVLDQFYTTWKADALVVDKWLAIQAATKLPIALQEVKKLMHHEAFDIKNPNKVYALIGTFGHRNPSNFHAIDGAGYVFLRECVQQLDKLNPQIAARMVKPLTTWKRYDKDRQDLMKHQLEIILADKKISNDLYELVSKSLVEK